MELDPEEGTVAILHRSHPRPVGGGDGDEPVRGLGDLVLMGHPDLLLLGQIPEQDRVSGHREIGVAVLGAPRVGDGAPGQIGNQLVAVTDAEDGDAHLQDGGVHAIGALGVHRGRAAGEDEADRVVGSDLLRADVTGDDLGADMALTHPPGDQLCVLGSKVQNQHRRCWFCVVGMGLGLGFQNSELTTTTQTWFIPSRLSDFAAATSLRSGVRGRSSLPPSGTP